MNFRTIWEVFGRQQAWSGFSRLKSFRRINPFIRSNIGIAKYPRTAIILSFTGLYNATNNQHNSLKECKISDGYLQDMSKELLELERLKDVTLICKKCQQRLLVDKPIDGKIYCKCEKNIAITDESTGWQPFLESKDIIIWRREEIPNSGLFEYKIYGRYEEVTAEDFLSMHTDLVYWKSWDESALTIKKLPHLSSSESFENQEIIYWETLWPRFFANRDYVYVRRHAYMEVDHKGINKIINTNEHPEWSERLLHHCDHLSKDPKCIMMFKKRHAHDDYGNEIDQDSRNNPENIRNAREIGNFMKSQLFQEKFVKKNTMKIIVLTSQSCDHPDAPVTNRAHRVKRYRSDLVIKPFTDVDKPGIEFSLTYFDDPGTSIPSALQSWVAGHACPDFLLKMRKAASNYKKSSQPSMVMNEPLAKVKENCRNVTRTNDNRKIENVIPKQLSPEDVKTEAQKMYKEKTKKDTEELLTILNGNNKLEEPEKTDKSTVSNYSNKEKKYKKNKMDSDTAIIQVEDQDPQDPQEQAVAEKQKETSQAMSFWHMWPLYYFA